MKQWRYIIDVNSNNRELEQDLLNVLAELKISEDDVLIQISENETLCLGCGCTIEFGYKLCSHCKKRGVICCEKYNSLDDSNKYCSECGGGLSH